MGPLPPYLAAVNNSSQKKPGGSLRIAHLIASRGVSSRREAERMIVNGRVRLNGKIHIDPAINVDPAVDEVLVDNQPLPEAKGHLYIALHKPTGFLSTFSKSKEKGETLEKLLPHERRLFTAGRLDRDSTGLLLLTTDGDWANHVMHPRHEKQKEYLVRFKGERSTPAAKKISGATFHEDGRDFGMVSAVPEGSYVRIVLKEGRNRHIRRVAESVGLVVRELIRVRIGPVHLGNLKPGHWRKLSSQEIRQLGTVEQ
ncbi:MAG: pseudouridine synthase [bacterium]